MDALSTTPAEELDLSAGQYVKGLPLAPTVFLVTTTFKQLRTITRNPVHLQAGRQARRLRQRRNRGRAGDPRAHPAGPGRQQVQERPQLPPVHRGGRPRRDGGPAPHPPVVRNRTRRRAARRQATTWWCRTANTSWPSTARPSWRRTGSSTQTATPENRKAHREFPLACILHHGISRSTARQYFHDLNVLAVRPNTSLGLSMDTKDPVMKVVGDLETRIPALFGQVEKQARQLKKNSPKIVDPAVAAADGHQRRQGHLRRAVRRPPGPDRGRGHRRPPGRGARLDRRLPEHLRARGPRPRDLPRQLRAGPGRRRGHGPGPAAGSAARTARGSGCSSWTPCARSTGTRETTGSASPATSPRAASSP